MGMGMSEYEYEDAGRLLTSRWGQSAKINGAGGATDEERLDAT